MARAASVDVDSALAAHNIQNNTTNKDTITMGSVAPSDLLTHIVGNEYFIEAISAEDFVKHHGAAEFNLVDVQNMFKTICADYGNDITLQDKSYSIDFCSKVLFEIGPESRKGDRKKDQLWKLKFLGKDKNGAMTFGVVFIATFRASTYKMSYEAGKKLCLTVKQAGLLAMDTFTRIAKLAIDMTPSVILLTPLAGSAFSRDDIVKIAADLNCPPINVVTAINASCQSGGQYLPESSVNIAIVSAIVATRNIKDRSVVQNIVGKTIKQYLAAKKVYTESRFTVYCKYAHGGVPSNMSVDTLINNYEQAQNLTMRQAITAAGLSATTSTV